MTVLPAEIGNLTELVYINLQENDITGLPDEIGNLVNLTKLYLRGNEITTLPETIGNLVNLVHLCLGRNQLTSLPDAIGNLSSLDTLHLVGNQLTSLPDSIVKLDHLTDLSLGTNEICPLSEELQAWADTNDTDWQNTQDCTTPIFNVSSEKQLKFRFSQIKPNPFNRIININYHVLTASYIKLEIFNTTGALIDLLVDGYTKAGIHSVIWNAYNLNSGTYYCQLSTGKFKALKRIILIK
jgi:Leucine-rich repeat (LRR) protein